jgi:hypothetical protein
MPPAEVKPLFPAIRRLQSYALDWRQELPVTSIISFDLRLSPWNKYWFLVLVILHGVRGNIPEDVSVPTATPKTSSGNLPRTPYKIPKTRNQYNYFINFFSNSELHNISAIRL